MQLYLLTHKLPLEIDAAGKLVWEPEYFAGLDPATRRADVVQEADRRRTARARRPDRTADPHEEIGVAQQMTISWLGEPIDQWIMMYGGDEADSLHPRRGKHAQVAAVARDRGALRGPRVGPVEPCAGCTIARAARTWSAIRTARAASSTTTSASILPKRNARAATLRVRSRASSRAARADRCSSTSASCTARTSSSRTPRRTTAAASILIWNVSVWNPYAVPLLKTSVDPVATP